MTKLQESFGRTRGLERLGREQFDVLVVGGGITGAGVALDAAARGLRTALVDKGDFASGTSSQSSKLVHGGLRYLQQYEVGLVFESLSERQTLLRNAPHLVQPLVFVIPLFGTGGVVDKAIARTYSLGLWMYDLFGGFRIGHRHRRVTADEVHDHLPTLRLDRLVAGFQYYDARADDARLTLAIVRTAAVDYGVVAVNHAPVVEILKNPAGAVCGASLTPEDTTLGPVDVRARVVVNATGVWADEVRDLDAPQPHLMRPAKGIHIAVPRAKLPCDAAVVLPSPSDGRNITVIPWDERTYVGTTDTDYEGDLDHPTVEAGDVAYLLEAVNAVVTDPVGPEDVMGTWSGLRPLLASVPGRRRPPNQRTADLSRRHTVLSAPSGLVTVTGGKLTTYRKMAQDTVDTVVRQLGLSSLRCSTKHLTIRGSNGVDTLRHPGTAARYGVSEETLAHLLSRYGDEVPTVLGVMAERPELGDRLTPGLPFFAGEVVYAARYEMATTVEDVLSRRTRMLLLDARAASSVAPRVAELLADELGWSSERIDREIADFVVLAASSLSMVGEGSAPAGAVVWPGPEGLR
ncbi:MAG: FAD-dependent oxidoreductase [Acidimicrobiales bacterium]